MNSDINWWGIIGIGLIILLLGGVIGFAIGGRVEISEALSRPETDPRAEYYRGVFDSCISFLYEVMSIPVEESRQWCAENLVVDFAAAGAYERESEGYIPPD